MNKMWCSACCAAVETIIKHEAAVLGPIIGASLGLNYSGSRRRASPGQAFVTTLLGAGLGFIAESVLIPKAQQLVCKDCGCSHLAALPS